MLHMSVSIVWFRSDLRLSDNPALIKALESGRPVVPVFVLDEETDGVRRLGAASRWWLHYSLHALDASLRRLGSRLILRRGPAEKVIGELVAECAAASVFWNRAYDRGTRERDARLKKALSASGVVAESFKASLLFEPWEVTTQSGGSFKVFTPFWRACRALPPPAAPLPAPQLVAAPEAWPSAEPLAAWQLLPTSPDWASGLRAAWTPGEDGAKQRLAHFLDDALEDYRQARDLPGAKGTSRLSPHLAFGDRAPSDLAGRTDAWRVGRH